MADMFDKEELGIVSSLFGMSPTMQNKAMQQAAYKRGTEAGQNLLGGVLGNVGMFAEAAGQGIRSGLGVQTPEDRLGAIRQQAQQQFDTNTPEGLLQMADYLNSQGDAAGARQAVMLAQGQQSRTQKIATDRATEQSKLRDQVKQVGLTTDGRQVYQSGANQFILTEQGPQPYYGKLESKTPKTTISMAGENEVSKVIGKGIGETQLKIAESGEAAAENLIKINETLTELKTGQAFTGQFADLQTNIAKAQAKFADDKKAGKKVTDTEYLDALLGSDVFPMISSLGIGARGLDTPAEREFLRKVMTGTIALERDTLIRLTETRKNIAERAVKKYNDKVESGELNKYFQLKGVEPKKIELPQATVATPEQAQQAPIYARNPSTNERIVSTDGGKTWNPVGGQ
jgi:hypothetical protein